MVLAVGIATGFAQVVQLNPAAGDHAYVPLPIALIVTELPVQMV